jgi:flagellar hook-associated protein 1 FlgK
VDDVSNLVTNDRFNLVPTRGAAHDLQLQITDSKEIAMASPVKTQASLNNSGNGRIALGPVINTASVEKQFRIDFISDTQYNLVNITDSTSTGPLNFTPNADNIIQIPDGVSPSYSITLSGLPKAGDEFSADFNAGGIGDNRNGLGLASMQQSKLFSGGTETLFDSYANLLADVGSETHQAEIRFKSANSLYNQAIDFQQSKSGVSLEEEAANLYRFKQAYEAAGKLMEVSSQMMNVLFDIMR